MPFKRSLASYPGAPPTARSRPTLLHEGFALTPPTPAIVDRPASAASVTAPHTPGGGPRDRGSGEPKPYGRGSAEAAITAAQDPQACRAELSKDIMAESTKGPAASRQKLWATLAVTAGWSDTFHLDPNMIFTVMGALKTGGYRSAQLYLDTAKNCHIALGQPWDCQLQQAYRSAVRSCKRGIGHPKQAAHLPLVQVAELLGDSALAPGKLPTVHDNGARAYTGHSARVTGARFMAMHNIELWRIQLFGRWGSDVFLHYIQDAPVAQLDRLALESTAAMSVRRAQEELSTLQQRIKDCKATFMPPESQMLEDCEASVHLSAVTVTLKGSNNFLDGSQVDAFDVEMPHTETPAMKHVVSCPEGAPVGDPSCSTYVFDLFRKSSDIATLEALGTSSERVMVVKPSFDPGVQSYNTTVPLADPTDRAWTRERAATYDRSK
ncbi:unnamed protein product [Durusdinium trenchii]|uniref:Uncharacterized protein n=1 Tax=Durusdinium trenchii TaxID=1381693 RepID=A0ABP0JHJ8_9DINO